ncbi:molybdopterin-dependent oxidoreductase [Zavarzinella formosa]|uniref:molybdopterin-dependent oxidoreductase n=1 Tax=Zavarzinella formosa TaxID=360055 RepID=UPI0002EFF3F0|nr:molybdopterin-dependent oxidoreductase [Zavarzinella formosa]
MATVYVNDKPVDIGNERLNCVQAAEKGGIHIPHYCYHPDLTVVASCRMCLVEMGDLKDGKVAITPKVFPGCQTPVKDGTVIVTGDYAKRDTSLPVLGYPDNYKPGDRAKKAQADTLEGLLINHPLDCPVCDKAGECKLQDYSFQYGRSQSRMIDEKNTPPNKPEISSKITLFTDRCIMCTRCVRFTREVSGQAELSVVSRGHHSEIDVFPGEPLENKLAGNVVDLCPVGALGSKDFLYKQRVWYLKTEDSVCAGCSTGCSISADSNKDVIFRLRPRPNPQAQGYFMCDEGRHGYHYVNAAERLNRPHVRKDGKLAPIAYTDAVKAVSDEFKDAIKKNAASVWLVLSPFLTVEEAFLAAKWLKESSKQVKLALGPVPFVGEDDTYPKDRRGKALQPVRFTIRAEKCPNRRGVEEVLRTLQGDVITFPKVIEAIKKGDAKAVFLAGGYPVKGSFDVFSEVKAENLLLAVSDFFTSPATELAKYVFPAAAFSEKEGTYLNHANLAQTLHKVSHAPQETRQEGQLFQDLAHRRGLFNLAAVRKELAKEVPFFGKLADQVPELGVKLV